jgi:hypothetical protein
MKHFNSLKFLLFIAFLGAVNALFGQVHPLGFGIAGSRTTSNWYQDYVGAKVMVTAPGSIAGPVTCKAAPTGTSGSDWPDIVWTSIVNKAIVMDTTADSFGSSAFPAGLFAGKIAVLWRGPIAPTPATFGLKAKNAQDAGALALVLINEYPGEGPIVPGYTATGTPIHIPVIMIGNLDGINISATYHTSPPGTVKMTITPWGLGLTRDLGILPTGATTFTNYATPANQIAAGGTQAPYLGVNGAFIANFGTSQANNVKLKSTTTFVPNVGTPSVERTDSIVVSAMAGNGTADTLTDSIMGMFPSTTAGEYSLAATTPGRYDIAYSLTSDSSDLNTSDNTLTTSFYLTDSLFSKGRYDFVNHVPMRGTYESLADASEMTWGPMYYVANGGQAIGEIQYAISNGKSVSPNPLVGSNDIYIFKWNDGTVGAAADSIVQDGELELLSWSTRNFSTAGDTSGQVLKHTAFYDASGANRTTVYLTSNTWYYIAIDIPAALSDTNRLGVDGVASPFPRIFARWWDHNGTYLDYSSFVTKATAMTATDNEPVIPFSQTSRLYAVDSFSYVNAQGTIPAVAFVATGFPDTSYKHVGVNNVQKPVNNLSIFPVPASDNLNISIDLAQTAGTITYKIIDGLGRFVAKETHSNVKSESFAINTSSLKQGHYYLLVSADGKNIDSKKFVIAR